MKVEILPELDIDKMADVKKIDTGYTTAYNAVDAIVHIDKHYKHNPKYKNAVTILGVTNRDLRNANGTLVLGVGSYTSFCGIFSFYRYSDNYDN